MSCQTVPHAGHWPPVSNVFHACPHEHDQRAEAVGSQEHLGQAIFMARRVAEGVLPAARAEGPPREDGRNKRRAAAEGRSSSLPFSFVPTRP